MYSPRWAKAADDTESRFMNQLCQWLQTAIARLFRMRIAALQYLHGRRVLKAHMQIPGNF